MQNPRSYLKCKKRYFKFNYQEQRPEEQLELGSGCARKSCQTHNNKRRIQQLHVANQNHGQYTQVGGAAQGGDNSGDSKGRDSERADSGGSKDQQSAPALSSISPPRLAT